MKSEELDYVRETVDQEGFDYTFNGYSHFKDIEDEEFHRLRQQYIDSAKELAKYLNVDI